MSRPRRIGIVTSARADFGLMQGLIKAVDADPDLSLRLFVTGMHHSKKHGHTIDEIHAAGLGEVVHEVTSFQDDDSAGGIARTMSTAIDGFATAFETEPPDILVILGDRFDAFPAALAALPFNIPIAHISGGELTEGAIDEAIRHSLTKFAHLHFPSTDNHGRRIRQLGEEAWRVVVTGQPGLDALNMLSPKSRGDVAVDLGLDPARPISIVTLHPETIDVATTKTTLNALMHVIETIDSQLIITASNTDTGNAQIRAAWDDLATRRADCVFIESLGHTRYLNVLSAADCMVGNSSSGVIEAASFKLPVVNIGARQLGRMAGANVIHCDNTADGIMAAWQRALDPSFRAGLADLVNPYGDGKAVPRILEKLKSVSLDQRLLQKHFVDCPSGDALRP